MQEIKAQLRPDRRLIDISADLMQPQAPAAVFTAAMAEFGHVDVLIANHARSGGDGSLTEITAEMLDAHWAVNARSSLLLAQELLKARDPNQAGR